MDATHLTVFSDVLYLPKKQVITKNIADVNRLNRVCTTSQFMEQSTDMSRPEVPDSDYIATLGSCISNIYFSEELSRFLGRDIGDRWLLLQQRHLRKQRHHRIVSQY